MKPFAAVAVAFAQALAEGRFGDAEAYLAPALRTSLTEVELRRNLENMLSDVDPKQPREVFADEEFQMETWPGKQAGDVGWAYVTIQQLPRVEAVTVIVADIESKLLIRNVEWMRP